MNRVSQTDGLMAGKSDADTSALYKAAKDNNGTFGVSVKTVKQKTDYIKERKGNFHENKSQYISSACKCKFKKE